ncbi:MAG: hypothetical protein KGH65_05955, partial [Candidatus Micrarchaeota archaeon]|nr:hypothetical protein [Candidatus Micrarchaeota archaeon]
MSDSTATTFKPTEKPLSHAERYGPAIKLGRLGYDAELAKKEAAKNIRDALPKPPSMKELEERLESGDHTPQADAN